MISNVLGQAGAAGRQARLADANNRSSPTRLQWQDAEFEFNMRKEPEQEGAGRSIILEALKEEKDRITINCGPDVESIAVLEKNINAQRDRLRKAAGLPPLTEVTGVPIQSIQAADEASEDYDRGGRSRQKN